MYDERSDRRQERSTEELLNRLEQAVNMARSVPFSNNCLVDREEMIVLTSMIRENLPAELKQARWLLQQNRQLIAEARKEAEQIIREAETRMAAMIDENEITQQARLIAKQTVDSANRSAVQIREGAIEYARQHLDSLEDRLAGLLLAIQKDLQNLK